MFGTNLDVKIPIGNDKVICILPQPPILQEIEPPVTPPRQEPPARQTSAANIQITDQPTDTQVTENQNIIPPVTSDEGTGDPVEYTGPAIVDVPIAAPPATPKIFNGAEIMPKFDEMAQFLSRKLKYPSSARRMGVTGKVFVGFVVAADGTITDVKVVKGIHPDCDKEAVRVVSMMPRWDPAMQNGQAVAVRMVVPINFQIQE